MTRSKDLWCKFRHKAAASVVLLFGLAILVVAWFFLPDLAGAGRSIPCAEPTETPSASPSATVSPAPPTAPVPLILEKPEGVVIDFGKDRGAHLRTVYLQVAKKTRPKGGVQFAKLIPESDVGVSERPLERQELEGHIGPKEYVATATVTDRKEVSLTICVDTSGASARPGDVRRERPSVRRRHPSRYRSRFSHPAVRRLPLDRASAGRRDVPRRVVRRMGLPQAGEQHA